MNNSLSKKQTIYQTMHSYLTHPHAFLLPLRLFLGLGWIRSGAEKIMDPTWFSGETILRFFEQQQSGSFVYFPFYEQLIQDVFIPNVGILLWLILCGEILAGIAIATGTFTNAALLGGMFMNLNFILSGRVNPSAFYVVISLVLLFGNAGIILGLDAWISSFVKSWWISAQKNQSKNKINTSLLFAILSFLFGVCMIPYIREFGPASVEDPAMLLCILSMILTLSFFIQMVTPKQDAQKVIISNTKKLDFGNKEEIEELMKK